MAKINEHYTRLRASYLFAEIGRRVAAFQQEHPDTDVIKLGIGDVTRALPPSIIKAFHAGIDEQASDETFHGYGPDQGYDFLREKILQVDFLSRGCPITLDEIFISDGAKCDTGNFQEIFSSNSTVAVPDPVYPVYVDTNVMAGRSGDWSDTGYNDFTYLAANASNEYVPSPPDHKIDLIYLCFPNNPTGAVATRQQLGKWVDYARQHDAILLFDAAYERFIRDPDIPHSIYEIPGAEQVAVEFRSLSKTAGFTGTRCAYTVVPKGLTALDDAGQRHSVWDLWNRRQATKFNGVSFPVQRAAEAVFTPQGQAEITSLADYYLGNAALIREAIANLGYSCVGGVNSPYVWIQTGQDSWEFFDRLLRETGVVTTPGAGFGRQGEGYIRISAFNHRDRVEAALERIAGLK